MLEKKTASIAIIVVLVSALFLVQFTTIAVKRARASGDEYDWETAVISSPQGMGTFMMFSDFRAENLHFSIALPAGGPGSPPIQLTFDVKKVETSPGAGQSLHLTAEKVRLSLLPLDSVAPVEVEIEAKKLTLDLAFWEPDGVTGQFGELAFKLEKDVKFRFALDPAPEWWNQPPVYENNVFAGRVVFLQPDYEITFVDYPESPGPLLAHPFCEWTGDPCIREFGVHVEPTRFYDFDGAGPEPEKPVTDVVWLNAWWDGELDVELHGNSMQTPPYTWPVTVRVHGKFPQQSEIEFMVRSGDGQQQWSNTLTVDVVPRISVDTDGPTAFSVSESAHPEDWQFNDTLLVVLVNPNDVGIPGYELMKVGLHWDAGDTGLWGMLFDVTWNVGEEKWELVDADKDGKPDFLPAFNWGEDWEASPGPLSPPIVAAVGVNSWHEHMNPDYSLEDPFICWLHYHDQCCYHSVYPWEIPPEGPQPPPSIGLEITVVPPVPP